MKKLLVNYETLLIITKAMSMSKDPKEVITTTVKSIRKSLDIKGAAIFLIDPQSNELELVASNGLSKKYLNKGPLSALKSIAESLNEGPIAINNIKNDSRLQYPEAAEKEGIVSILSLPIYVRGKVVGNMRIYTSEPWHFSSEDVSMVQALAQMSGIVIDMCRHYEGQNEMIDILTKMREAVPL